MATRQWKPLAICLLICYVVNVHNFSTIYCPWAVNTVKTVSSCPITKEERDKASDLKNCKQFARKQNCSDPSKFQYHCVMNELQNALLEVCAPTRYILGYCPEFNVKGGIIQDHYSLECIKFEPPCENRYISTDAYLYHACYDQIKMSTVSDVILSTSASVNGVLVSTTSNITTDVRKTETPLTDIIIGITIPTLVVVCLVVTAACYFKLHTKRIPCWRGETRLAGNEERNQERLAMLKELEAEITVGGEGSEDKEAKNSKINVKRARQAYNDLDAGEDAESLISTDSYTDLSAKIRGTLLLEMASVDHEGNASEENERKTRGYLESFKEFDDYFVETNVFRHVKDLLQAEGIAIMTGFPGCGKTNTAVHLMLEKTYESWTKHMIYSWKDLSFLKSDKDTLVFIDNIFDGYMYSQELERWWDSFYNIFYGSIQKSEKGFVSISGGKIRLLITAKENIIEKACAYMNKPSPIFKSNCIVNMRDMELTSQEKDDIFEMQMKYAEQVKGIKPPVEDMNENSKFRKEIRKSDGPIGFPLCAHLFACNEKYRPMGSNFFSNPISYLQAEIMHEINSDSSNRTKTLFLILFLNELNNHSTNRDEHVCLVEIDCKEFMKNVLNDDLEQLQPLNFANLKDIAMNYTGTLLSDIEKSNIYRFKHNTIYDAVGDYFLREHFEYTVKVFPLDILETREFSMCEETQCDALISRFISEVNKGNVSKVFACKALNCHTHAERFYRYLSEQTKPFLTAFLATTDLPSGFSLPPTFWISKHGLSFLTTLLFKMMKRKGINTNLHIYFSLFGELCARDENLLKMSKEKINENMKNTIDVIHNFDMPNGNSILHFVMQSELSDIQSVNTVKRLIKDASQRKKRIKINKENDNGEFPISTAAKHDKHSRILSCLAIIQDKEENVRKTDHNGFSPIHHAVSTLASKDYNSVLELEVMVRLAIFMTYSVNPDLKNEEKQTAIDMCEDSPYGHVREMLCCEMAHQDDMANLIEAQISRIKVHFEIDNSLCINNPINKIGEKLIQAIRKSISILYQVDI